MKAEAEESASLVHIASSRLQSEILSQKGGRREDRYHMLVRQREAMHTTGRRVKLSSDTVETSVEVPQKLKTKL